MSFNAVTAVSVKGNKYRLNFWSVNRDQATNRIKKMTIEVKKWIKQYEITIIDKASLKKLFWLLGNYEKLKIFIYICLRY